MEESESGDEGSKCALLGFLGVELFEDDNNVASVAVAVTAASTIRTT